MLTSPTIAKPFDDAKETILLTDASRLRAHPKKQEGRIIADSVRIEITPTLWINSSTQATLEQSPIQVLTELNVG